MRNLFHSYLEYHKNENLNKNYDLNLKKKLLLFFYLDNGFYPDNPVRITIRILFGSIQIKKKLSRSNRMDPATDRNTNFKQWILDANER